MTQTQIDIAGIPFAQVLGEFAQAPWHDVLFDFGTRLWAEGPDYLGSLFYDTANDSHVG